MNHDDKHPKIDAKAGYEKRDVYIKGSIIATIVIVIFIVASIAFVDEIFVHKKEQIIQETVLKPESINLRDLRAAESEILGSYKLLDASKGVYRIPIDRAMKLVADEAYSASTPASK